MDKNDNELYNEFIEELHSSIGNYMDYVCVEYNKKKTGSHVQKIICDVSKKYEKRIKLPEVRFLLLPFRMYKLEIYNKGEKNDRP